MRIHRINASRRPTMLLTYYVEGVGLFPTIMLQRAQCWPDTEEDAREIGALAGHGIGLRRLSVSSYQRPDPAQWAEFLWEVVQ